MAAPHTDSRTVDTAADMDFVRTAGTGVADMGIVRTADSVVVVDTAVDMDFVRTAADMDFVRTAGQVAADMDFAHIAGTGVVGTGAVVIGPVRTPDSVGPKIANLLIVHLAGFVHQPDWTHHYMDFLNCFQNICFQVRSFVFPFY